jgi:hypothetical protein
MTILGTTFVFAMAGTYFALSAGRDAPIVKDALKYYCINTK